MKPMFRAAFALVAALVVAGAMALAAYAAESEATLPKGREFSSQEWIGQSAGKLAAEMGQPDQSLPLSDGTTLLVYPYVQVVTGAHEMRPPPWVAWVAAYAMRADMPVVCQAEFVAGTDGSIRDAGVSGQSCPGKRLSSAVQPKSMDFRSAEWIGKSVEKLTAEVGQPRQSIPLADGTSLVVFSYAQEVKGAHAMRPSPSWLTTYAMQDDMTTPCRVDIIAGADGSIRDAGVSGQWCPERRRASTVPPKGLDFKGQEWIGKSVAKLTAEMGRPQRSLLLAEGTRLYVFSYAQEVKGAHAMRSSTKWLASNGMRKNMTVQCRADIVAGPDGSIRDAGVSGRSCPEQRLTAAIPFRLEVLQ